MNPVNLDLHELLKPVEGLAPIAPSSSTPDYVCLKNFNRLYVVIQQNNGAAATGSAITLLQASAVAGTGAKALAFSTYWANTNTASSDTLTETTASSNTFTTDNTANLNSLYYITVDPADLDTANNFDCVRAGTANATNSVVSVLYLLAPKYAGGALDAITD